MEVNAEQQIRYSYFKKFVYGNAPIVRVPLAPERRFSHLRGCYFYESVASQDEQGQWIEMPDNLIIEQGTDQVLTWQRPYVIGQQLSEGERVRLPNMVRRQIHNNGLYTVSKLGEGPFRFLNVEYTRDQFIALQAQLRPDCIGVTYPTSEDNEVSFHEAGDAYGEWTELFHPKIELLLSTRVGDVHIKLYRVFAKGIIQHHHYQLQTYGTITHAMIQPEVGRLFVGFQEHGPEYIYDSPEVYPTIFGSWSIGLLRDVLTPTEQAVLSLFYPPQTQEKAAPASVSWWQRLFRRPALS